MLHKPTPFGVLGGWLATETVVGCYAIVEYFCRVCQSNNFGENNAPPTLREGQTLVVCVAVVVLGSKQLLPRLG